MNLVSLFHSPARAQQARQEADRIQRYEYDLRVVKRWTQAREAYIQEGAEMTRQLDEQIARHITQWGPDSKGLPGL